MASPRPRGIVNRFRGKPDDRLRCVAVAVRKVLASAAEKGMHVEHKPLGLGADDPDFLAGSPFRKFPGFQEGDFTISDSSVIITCLEGRPPASFDSRRAQAQARARTICYDAFVETLLFARGGKMFFNRTVAPMILGLRK